MYILPPRGHQSPTWDRPPQCPLRPVSALSGEGKEGMSFECVSRAFGRAGPLGMGTRGEFPQPPRSSGQRASTRSSPRWGWQVTGLQSLCPLTWKMKGVIPSPAPRDYEDKMRIFWQVLTTVPGKYYQSQYNRSECLLSTGFRPDTV